MSTVSNPSRGVPGGHGSSVPPRRVHFGPPPHQQAGTPRPPGPEIGRGTPRGIPPTAYPAVTEAYDDATLEYVGDDVLTEELACHTAIEAQKSLLPMNLKNTTSQSMVILPMLAIRPLPLLLSLVEVIIIITKHWALKLGLIRGATLSATQGLSPMFGGNL